MDHERVLVTGCGGMLGNAIFPYFETRCSAIYPSDIQIEDDEKSWLHYLDVRDSVEVAKAMDDFKPDMVLHLAAMVDLEACELKPDEAEEKNVTATRIVAENAKRHDTTLVYISTGGVFDGERTEGYYTEDDDPNPIMVYGATKLRGEHIVREVWDRHFIIRPGWMVGGGRRNDHKFVSLILEQIESGAKVIHAVDDARGTPTYTHDFAMNLFVLLDTNAYGTYHMVCKDWGTRWDMAQHIVDVTGRSKDVNVVPVIVDFFKERFFVRRPACEMLFNRRLEDMGINHMRPWRIAIQEYLLKEYADLVVAD